MNIPYADSSGILNVRVKLQNAADVFLVDSVNFRLWKERKRFKYFGGYYNKSPVVITVSGRGRWYLIVQGSAKYEYSFY